VIKIDFRALGMSRQDVFKKMQNKGIGVNVHYIPVHLHPFYRNKFGTSPGLCPMAEAAYEQILSLPMYAGMTDEDVETVWSTLKYVIDR
jgi:perosamine synthetase